MNQPTNATPQPSCPRLAGQHCGCTAYCAEYFKGQSGHKDAKGEAPAVATTALLNLDDDTPLQAPACSLDGGPCESCQ